MGKVVIVGGEYSWCDFGRTETYFFSFQCSVFSYVVSVPMIFREFVYIAFENTVGLWSSLNADMATVFVGHSL